MKLTHDWFIYNGFTHHSATKMNVYTRDGFYYIHDDGEEFGVRLRNFINSTPVKNTDDMIALHRIVSGVTIPIRFKQGVQFHALGKNTVVVASSNTRIRPYMYMRSIFNGTSNYASCSTVFSDSIEELIEMKTLEEKKYGKFCDLN